MNLNCIIGTVKYHVPLGFDYKRLIIGTIPLNILEVFVVTLAMDRVKIFMDASVNLNVSCSLRLEREAARERGPALISRC